MKLITRDVLSIGSERAWLGCFGPYEETMPFVVGEADRLFACAVVFADDLRHLPEYALSQAGPEERFLFALAYCRLLRDVEAGRVAP